MSKSILEISEITYAIDDDDINTYGDHNTAADAMDLPETFQIAVDDNDDDMDAAIQVFAEENFGVRLDAYDYEVIGEQDDDDYDDYDDYEVIDDDERFGDEDDLIDELADEGLLDDDDDEDDDDE